MVILFLSSCCNKEGGSSQSNNNTVKKIPTRNLVSTENPFISIEDKMTEDQKNSILNMNKSFKNSYPSYYAGYTLELEQLVILVIGDDTLSIKKDLLKRIGNDNFNIGRGKYEYKTLLNVEKKIIKYIAKNENSDVVKNIELCVIQGNRVFVYLKDYSHITATQFRNEITDSPVVSVTKKRELYNTAD